MLKLLIFNGHHQSSVTVFAYCEETKLLTLLFSKSSKDMLFLKPYLQRKFLYKPGRR